MPRATIKDIANALTLSPSTVSRALSEDPSINAETRRRVSETARRLGYRRNSLASSLRRGRTQSVGLVLSEFTSPFTCVVAEGILQYMYQRGVRVMSASSYYDPERELSHLQMMEQSMVDGIIFLFSDPVTNYNEFQRLSESRFPMVFIGSYPKGLPVARITADVRNRAFFLFDHLLHQGYRRIAVIDTPPNIGMSGELVAAYRDALDKYRLDFDSRLTSTSFPTPADGIAVVNHLVREKIDFDCIVTYADYMAVGIIMRLRELGFRVPEQVAMATLYGTLMSRLITPQLTTMETPLLDTGRLAAQMLLDQIDSPDMAPQHHFIDLRLKVRSSTVIGSNFESPFLVPWATGQPAH